MKLVKVFYLSSTGKKMQWTCSEENLERVLEKCEYKGLKVIDWVYNE